MIFSNSILVPKLHCFCNFGLKQWKLLATILESSYQRFLVIVLSIFFINKFHLKELIQSI